MSGKLSLCVQFAGVARDLPTRAQFRRWVNAALQHQANITLRIVDEAEGRELNRIYRDRDYATNVLTFVYDGVQQQHVVAADARQLLAQTAVAVRNTPLPLSGDIVICAPVVQHEAGAQNRDVLAHYAHLTLHAVLHLQGYEHEDEAAAAEMEALETALMLKLRYPDPYRI